MSKLISKQKAISTALLCGALVISALLSACGGFFALPGFRTALVPT